MYSVTPPRGSRPGPSRADGPLAGRRPAEPSASDPEDAAQERDEIAIARQHRAFDAVAEELAELRREAAVLHDMQLEQMKHDDEIVKEWIRLI